MMTKINFCLKLILVTGFILNTSFNTILAQGSTCADAISITVPTTLNNQTSCNKGADYSTGYCKVDAAEYTNGLDVVYTFTAVQDGCVLVKLTNLKGTTAFNAFASVLLEGGCPGSPSSTCLGRGEVGWQGDGSITYHAPVLSGHTYYIIVDIGRKNATDCITTFNMNVTYDQCPPLPVTGSETGTDCGSNLGFEQGNTNNWTGSYNDDATNYSGPPINPPIVGFSPNPVGINGTLGACGASNTNPPNSNTTSTPRHTITTGTGKDPNTGNAVSIVAPGGGLYSFRLGSQEPHGGCECVQTTFTPNASKPIFTYLYAVVSNDEPWHTANVKARFEMSLKDQNGVALSCGGQYQVTSGAREGDGFIQGPNSACGGNLTFYSPWRAVSVDLTSYIGQTLTLKFCTSDCAAQQHYSYAYIDAYCYAKAIQGTTLCSIGNPITLTAPIGFSDYKWYIGGYPVTGSPIGTGPTLTVPSPVNGTIYTVTYENLQKGICATSSYTTDTIKVFNTSAKSDTTICTGTPGNFILTATSNDPSSTYTWSSSPAGFSSSQQNPAVPMPTVTTTYSVSITSGSGCPPSTETIVVTVNPCGFTATATSATVCSGACATITSTGIGGNPSYIYSWKPATGLSATNGSSISACPTSTTTYTVTVTDNNGSGTTASAQSVVTVNPGLTISVGNVSICTGGSTPLTASGGTTYTWSPATGLSSTTGTTVTASPTIATTYTVVGTTNGCTGSTTVIVAVGALVPNAGSNVTICPGTSANLNASGGSNYTWTPATGLSSTTISNPTANPSSTTTYTVTVTSGSCTGTASVVVTVGTNLTLIVPPATICSGTSTTLTASGATTYTWSPGTSLSATTGTSVTANPTITTTYTVIGTSGGCTGSTTVVVAITSGPTISVTSGTTCAGIPITLTVNGATNYTWTPSTGLSATTGNSVFAGPTATTTYTVTGSSGGCSGTATTLVTILPTPVANFTISPAGVVAPNKEISFTDISTNPGIPTWDFGDPLSGTSNTSTFTSPTHTYTSESDYCITLTSTNTTTQCADTVTKCIVVMGEAVIIFPNVFTPNGDGKNDIFYFYSKGVSKITCTIYDRWGLKMYEWDAVTGGWDGLTKSGKEAPDGVYYFMMEATPANGDPVIPKHGFLQLLKEK